MTSNSRPISSIVRVLVLSRSEIIRAGLRLLLESRSGLKVVGEAGISETALSAVRIPPDILLVEIESGSQRDLELLPKLVESAKNGGVVVLTSAPDPEAYCAVVRLGVMGLVTRTDRLENLFRAIERVHSGGVWLERPVMEGLLTCVANRDNQPAAPAESLTLRERQVVKLVGEALNNRQIAARLFVSETTVRHHLTSVFGKLGVSSRLELVKYAYSTGLAPLGSAVVQRSRPQFRAV